ncbi:MAG TPA: Usg family protein [Stellaceae bacterium]|nr:Usg family protein [Stellaceae bacterium]
MTAVTLLSPDRYRLTTAEITYRLPDHPLLLQTYIWQKFDIAPEFPVLHGFLQFWRENLEGELHSVRVGQGPARKHRFPLIPLPESSTRH